MPRKQVDSNLLSPEAPVDETEQIISELAPIAKEILAIISQNDYDLGIKEKLDPLKVDIIAKKVLTLILERDIRYTDKQLLFQLVMQAVEQVQVVVLASLGKSFDLALNKLFTKDFLDLKLSDLDKVMKA